MSAATLEAKLGHRWRKPPFISNDLLRWGLAAGVVVYLVLAFASFDVNWARVNEGLTRGWLFIKAFMSPDFLSRGTDIREGMLESVIITVPQR